MYLCRSAIYVQPVPSADELSNNEVHISGCVQIALPQCLALLKNLSVPSGANSPHGLIATYMLQILTACGGFEESSLTLT